VVYCVAQGGVFKTANTGDQWFPRNLEFITDIAIDPSDSDVLLAVPLGTPNFVFKSTDAGDTWSPRSLSARASSPQPILWDGGRPNRVFFLAFQGSSSSVYGRMALTREESGSEK